MSITAFCPGHISGYFRRIEGDSKETTGSIGAGIVISEGVTATVSLSDRTSVCIRQRSRDGVSREIARHSPPLESALERIGIHADVVTECCLPIGAGFGLSAAALLATLTAADRVGEMGMSTHDITRIAHETEVEHRTGLGDVAACQDGGRVVRKGPGVDAEIDRFFDLPYDVYAVSFGPIHTPTVIGSPEQMERVARAFPQDQPRTVKEFFHLSREFAGKSGLVTPEVAAVFTACEKKGVLASMTMLGNGVFAYGTGADLVLRQFGEVYSFRMAQCGTRIIGGTS